MEASSGTAHAGGGTGHSIKPEHVGAAVSKLVSASIGDIVVVFSRSPRHKHYSLADIEWLIVPAVVTGQAYIAELQHKEHGGRAPVAAVLWASVSNEIDQRLSTNPGERIRLKPDEWKSGAHLWIVDVAGDPRAIAGALADLAAARFRERQVKLVTSDEQGAPYVATLRELLVTIPESKEVTACGP